MKVARVRPWHRMQGLDTDSSWPVFQEYYMTEPARRGRILPALARKHAVPIDTIYHWSAEALWRKRAREFDRVQGIEATRLHLRDKRPADARHRALTSGIVELCTIELKKKLRNARRLAKLGQLTDRDLARLTDVGVKLERLIEGKPTERIEDAKRIDLTKLTLEELKNLQELQKKAGVKE